MNLIELLVKSKRLILTTALLLAAAGLFSWMEMKRQEDPFFPYRNGFVLVQYPGADVETIENLVMEPIQEEITQLEEVAEVKGVARAGFAQVIIRMKETVYNTDTAWNRIRDAIDRAELQFPEGVNTPIIEDKVIDSPVAVYAISGMSNSIQMRTVAEDLKKKLLRLSDVSKVKLYGQVDEEISIKINTAKLKNLNISADLIASQIADKTKIVPLKIINANTRQVVLNAKTEYQSIEEIENTQIQLRDGTSLPLKLLATVEYGVKQDPSSVFWLDGHRAIGIGVYVPTDKINVVKFGHSLEDFMANIAKQYPETQFKKVFFQPQRVADRIKELGQSLLLGMVLVSLVLTFFLGFRPGLVVASIIPLVTFTALAIYDFSGHVLHQMAISGMVIALGMLVDNAIVMVENIQYHIDQGLKKSEASIKSVKQLAMSLLSATGTTLAAFLPMLMSKGNTGDFTNAIPVIIMLSITVSYVYSILVTPAFSHLFLKKSEHSKNSKIMDWGTQFGRVATSNSKLVLLIAALFIAFSMFLFGFVKKDFFPSTDRNQIIVDISFAEGTNLKHNSAFARELSLQILQQPHVRHAYVFSGNSGPNFYYNLVEKPRSPNISRITVELESVNHAQRFTDWIDNEIKPLHPNVEIIANRLGQGPPVTAAIEIRVLAESRMAMSRAIELIQASVVGIEGSRDVRNNLGVGLPSFQFEFKDEFLNRYGLTREQLTQLIGLQTSGLIVGQYRAGNDPVQIVLRSEQGSDFKLQDLENLEIQLPNASIPLKQFVDIEMKWLPAAIHHHDMLRTASVFSETKSGYTYTQILKDLEPKLEELKLPKGVDYVIAGTSSESDKANQSLGGALPLGIILLLMFLLIEFNSYRKVGIILITIPLAFAGVPIGLLLTNTTFGFTAILGILTLIGIVVNNAIVMLDLIQKNLDAGIGFNRSIIDAVRRRARPILLTTITTVAGLLPLVITKSTLWPPLAWTIISGLTFSTFMSLLVVPALYKLIISNKIKTV